MKPYESEFHGGGNYLAQLASFTAVLGMKQESHRIWQYLGKLSEQNVVLYRTLSSLFQTAGLSDIYISSFEKCLLHARKIRVSDLENVCLEGAVTQKVAYGSGFSTKQKLSLLKATHLIETEYVSREFGTQLLENLSIMSNYQEQNQDIKNEPNTAQAYCPQDDLDFFTSDEELLKSYYLFEEPSLITWKQKGPMLCIEL